MEAKQINYVQQGYVLNQELSVGDSVERGTVEAILIDLDGRMDRVVVKDSEGNRFVFNSHSPGSSGFIGGQALSTDEYCKRVWDVAWMGHGEWKV